MNITKLQDYHIYHVKLDQGKIIHIQQKGTNINHFVHPATKNKLSKLYVVKYKSRIIYIGITSRGFRERLRYGLSAKGDRNQGGYYGYKWKHLDEVEILLWFFPGQKFSNIEGIEGELVYLVRNNTGKWPDYQMEIHFHNCTREEKNIAKAIYKESVK